MWTDELVEEVRRQREAYAVKFNYDLDAMYRDLKVQEQQAKYTVVSFAPKRPVRITVKPKTAKVVAA